MWNKREDVCVSVYIYIYNIRASAAGGGWTNRRIPLHHTYKTYTMAMTTTTGNISSCSLYIYIYIILYTRYTTNTIYYYLLLCRRFPTGPIDKTRFSLETLFEIDSKAPDPRYVHTPVHSSLFSPRFYSINRWFTQLLYDDDDHDKYIPLLQRARYFSFSRFSFLLSSECFQFARRPKAPRVDGIATRSSAKKFLVGYFFSLLLNISSPGDL